MNRIEKAFNDLKELVLNEKIEFKNSVEEKYKGFKLKGKIEDMSMDTSQAYFYAEFVKTTSFGYVRFQISSNRLDRPYAISYVFNNDNDAVEFLTKE